MRAKSHLEAALKGVISDLGYAFPDKTITALPKDKQFGDMATNVAMILANSAKLKPADLAGQIRSSLAGSEDIAAVQIAGPGFINVFFTKKFWQRTVIDILEADSRYGQLEQARARKVMVEYVSANPTGPLHIGHGRGAALGDSLARILRHAGHEVITEYYINDAGKQMTILGDSVLFRVKQALGVAAEEPEDYYKGEYIKKIAASLLEHEGHALLNNPKCHDICRNFAAQAILEGIKSDLNSFRVEHANWFSEQRMVSSGLVEETINLLLAKDLAYLQDNAVWFRSANFGDDKDRVLRKSDGSLTYFASDIAYHADKLNRGVEWAVDIWGADHHGYVGRMKAAVQAALDLKTDWLEIILVHLVTLLRHGEQVPMSTRAGEFITLREVLDEVGVDAARFMFLSRKNDSPLDFDLDLMKQKNMDNPVYYVQYANARIHSLLRKAREAGFKDEKPELTLLEALNTEEDLDLLKQLEQFPDIIFLSASNLSPHYISYYLIELAGLLHKYYSTHQILSETDIDMAKARLLLFRAIAVVIKNGLHLLGVAAPEKM